jgi:sugar phosphate isomerase/epimerase
LGRSNITNGGGAPDDPYKIDRAKVNLSVTEAELDSGKQWIAAVRLAWLIAGSDDAVSFTGPFAGLNASEIEQKFKDLLEGHPPGQGSWRDPIGAANHEVGMLFMEEDPGQSITDTNCKFHTVENSQTSKSLIFRPFNRGLISNSRVNLTGRFTQTSKLIAIAIVWVLAWHSNLAQSAEPSRHFLFSDRLGFQLYSARKFPPVEAQLRELASLGYRYVEFQADAVPDPLAMRVVLAESGLSSPSGHFDINKVRQNLGKEVSIAQIFDIHTLVLAWLPPETRPVDSRGWDTFGRELNNIADRLSDKGLALAWHNHDYELAVLPDGSVPLEHILAAAPGLFWEPDIGWITRAGRDPLPWLSRYRDRIRFVHLKDVAQTAHNANEDGWADVGYGVVNWKRLLPALAATNAELFIIEHDNPSDYVRFARRSRDVISRW